MSFYDKYNYNKKILNNSIFTNVFVKLFAVAPVNDLKRSSFCEGHAYPKTGMLYIL